VRLSQTLAIIALLIGFSSCGTGSDSDTKDVSQDQLLASDLADLGNYKSAGAIQYDQQNNGIFTQIFGGTTSADLTNYLNTRVHYYIDKDQDVSISPADFQNMGWTQETLLKTLADTNNDATVCAVNVSIEYWILGLLNNTLVTFNFNDQNVPLTSARTGIVVLGDGYSDTIAIKFCFMKPDTRIAPAVCPIFSSVELARKQALPSLARMTTQEPVAIFTSCVRRVIIRGFMRVTTKFMELTAFKTFSLMQPNSNFRSIIPIV
jgi:hypothetical protein